MPTEIAIHDAEAQKALQKLIDKVKEVKDGGRAIGMALSAVVFRDIMEHFEREEGPDGAWKPWSDIYADHMRKVGKSGNKLLQDTGTLRQAFQPTSYRSVSEGIMWYNPARTKSGFPYAYHHNETRPFMWTSDDASEKIAEVTLNFVLGKTG